MTSRTRHDAQPTTAPGQPRPLGWAGLAMTAAVAAAFPVAFVAIANPAVVAVASMVVAGTVVAYDGRED